MKPTDNHIKDYKNTKGDNVPSVTTVLKILNNPILVRWANSLGFRRINYKKVLEHTSSLGTNTHQFIEESMQEMFTSIRKYDNKLDYEQSNTMKAYKKWRHEKVCSLNKKEDKFKTLYLEKRLVSEKYNYGGTIDYICKCNGHTYVLDFKTSSGIYPSMFIQLSAYAMLCEEHGIDVDVIGIIRFDKKTGSYQELFLKIEHAKKYKELFLILLKAYNYWNAILKEDWNTEFKNE